MQARIEIVEPRLFAGAVADEIVASISEIIAEHGRCSLVLSGGSTPAAVYRALATPPRVSDVNWDKVLFFWGDERWVSHDDSRSNFKMASETLLSNISSDKLQVFPIETSLPSPAAGASQYAKTISGQKLREKNALPVFDLVLLGMGEDGHVASVFPGSALIGKSGALCEAVVHPQDKSERVTLTPALLFNAQRIIFIVSGQSKAEMFRRVINKDGDVRNIPARLYEQAIDKVSWFVDSAAASQIKV